jgi:hypothetical protein
MTALVDRVENGVAPDSIPAAQVEASEFSERGFSVRTPGGSLYRAGQHR